MRHVEAELEVGRRARPDVALEVMGDDAIDHQPRPEIEIALEDLQRLGRAVARQREVLDTGTELASQPGGVGVLVCQRIGPGKGVAERHDVVARGSLLPRPVDPGAAIVGVNVEGKSRPVGNGRVDVPRMGAGTGDRADFRIVDHDAIAHGTPYSRSFSSMSACRRARWMSGSVSSPKALASSTPQT